MPFFSVSINGVGFLIETDAGLKRLGFYTSREVEAPDPGAAESAAVQLMRDSERLRDLVRNPPDDPPRLFVEEIVEIASIDPDKPVPGFSFYDDEPDEAGDEASG